LGKIAELKSNYNFLFISFVPPKETNQRKGGRKRQVLPVSTLATQSLVGAKKQPELRTVSGLPSRFNFGFQMALENFGRAER
jgi:hypothetical protein